MAPKYNVSTVQIFFSSVYSDFRMINGNRDLNENKIKRIIEEINSGNDILKYCPILVKYNGQHFEIVDGQHRFWICTQLKRPVHFIIVQKDMDMYAIASVNSNTEKWKYSDFLNCYIRLGNEEYVKLQNFMDQYNIGHKVAVCLLAKGATNTSGIGLQEMFERGKFQVKFEERAHMLASAAARFKKFPLCMGREFVSAIMKIIDAGICDMDDLVAKFESAPELLTRQATFKEYLTNLEQVYNHRMRTRRYIC